MAFLPYARFGLVALCLLWTVPMSSVVMAQDEEPKDEITETVRERVEAFTADLDEAEQKHFIAVYGSHNIIQVVEDVRAQVGDAVEKCGDVNLDMKDALKTRYKSWDVSLETIIDDASANVDNMIIAQEYAKPRAIKKLLKFADKKRVSREKEVEKHPVTTPEACEYLREKMDETQESLSRLLESTLVSLPNALINDAAKDESSSDE